MQKLNESEDKFMFDLVKLYCTANPDTTTTNLDWAVKRKFLVGILPSLQSAIFVSCQDSTRLIYPDIIAPTLLMFFLVFCIVTPCNHFCIFLSFGIN